MIYISKSVYDKLDEYAAFLRHSVSYTIDEAVYRWNTRKASQSERFSDMFNKSIGLIVTWSELKLCKVA